MKLAFESGSWYVAETRPNLEERALSKLTGAGFTAYLPRYRVDIRSRRRGTWRTVTRVLLTGYLFVDMTNGQFGKARACDGVRGFVGACGVPERVSGKFIQAFQAAEIDGAFDRLHAKSTAKRDRLAKQFTVGTEVRIDVGPFAAFAAVVREVTDRARVRVELQLFGREMDVEIDAEHLSAAESFSLEQDC